MSLAEALYSTMILFQNEGYVAMAFLGVIIMVSILMYRQAQAAKPYYSPRDNPPNQIYRKQDPQTRYDDDGTRYQCVAIPYRIVNKCKVEIYMITSRTRGDYIFPGGGWEKNESRQECVQREAFEEAGIRGIVGKELVSDQKYISDKGNKSRLWGYLLEVTDVLDEWPEPERRRKWMTINEADIALVERRKPKFGALWKHAIEYFVERNLHKHKRKNKNY